MSIGKIFYSDFGLFYQVPMDSGPLYDVTNTIDTYVYRGPDPVKQRRHVFGRRHVYERRSSA